MIDRVMKRAGKAVTGGWVDRSGDGKPDQPLAIDQHDGVSTTSEALLPGHSLIEKVRWGIQQVALGLTIPAIVQCGLWVYRYSPLVHSHALLWLALMIWVVWLVVERLNAFIHVRSWSLVSGFLVFASAGFGLALLLGGI